MSSSAFPVFNCSMTGYQLINKPASLGIKTLAPGPRSYHQTPVRPDAYILFKLKACSKTLEVCGRISYYFYYVNFVLYDVTGMIKLYFMHIILYINGHSRVQQIEL